MAAAAPATSAMPIVPKSTGSAGGIPGAARNMPITAVNTISATTRGFVNSRYCRNIEVCVANSVVPVGLRNCALKCVSPPAFSAVNARKDFRTEKTKTPS